MRLTIRLLTTAFSATLAVRVSGIPFCHRALSMPTSPDTPLSCTGCGLRKKCLPKRMTREAVTLLDASIRRQRYVKGARLYREGQTFRQLYVLRSGSVRVTSHADAGEAHVLGFNLPGDMLGFDGTATGVHTCSAEALEESNSCALTVRDLSRLLAQDPRVGPHLLILIGAELARAQAHTFLLMQPSPHARIAAFLDDLAHRYGVIKRNDDKLVLPMTRRDIASFTGLAIETVSRALTKLDAEGVLKVVTKNIEILDRTRLRAARKTLKSVT